MRKCVAVAIIKSGFRCVATQAKLRKKSLASGLLLLSNSPRLAHFYMTASNSRNKTSTAGTGRPSRNNRGVGMAELIIVVAIVGIVSAVAVVQIKTSRSALRVQNSIRQLASYMEKAR